MCPQDEALWRDILNAAEKDDGAAARDHLNAGFPVYYCDENTPYGMVVKQHPDGRRELVSFDASGRETTSPP